MKQQVEYIRKDKLDEILQPIRGYYKTPHMTRYEDLFEDCQQAIKETLERADK